MRSLRGLLRRVLHVEGENAARTRSRNFAEERRAASARVMAKLEEIIAAAPPLTVAELARHMEAARAGFDAERSAPEPTNPIVAQLARLAGAPCARNYATGAAYAAALGQYLSQGTEPASNAGGTAGGEAEGAPE